MQKVKWVVRRISDCFSTRAERLILMFGIEGFLYQFVTSMTGASSFATNLYATNLGATDSQLGMISMVSSLSAFALMLPAGIIADRMKNAKTMPIVIMLILGVGDILYGTIPAMMKGTMTPFFMLLPLTAGMLSIYNTIWQAFFGDVTTLRERNRIYASRNKVVYFVCTTVPLACSVMFSAMSSDAGKLTVLRIFFCICGAFNLLNAFVLSKMPGGERSPEQLAALPKVSARGIGSVLKDLLHSRRYLAYFLPIMLFYMSWHLDWSVWYIGQINYVGLTEAQLSLYTALSCLGQFAMMGFFGRMVEKKGVKRTFLWPILSLVMCPVFMMTASSLPEGLRPAAFIVLGMIICAPQAATNLCLVPMLLDAVPEKNRSLAVSLSMMCVTLSNAFLPYLGVKIYTALGADRRAFMIFMSIELVLRACTLILFAVRAGRKTAAAR